MKCRKVKYESEAAAAPELKRLRKAEGAKTIFTYWHEECQAFHNGHNLALANQGELDRLAHKLEHRQRIAEKRAVRPCKHVAYETLLRAFKVWEELGSRGAYIQCPRCQKYRVVGARSPKWLRELNKRKLKRAAKNSDEKSPT